MFGAALVLGACGGNKAEEPADNNTPVAVDEQAVVQQNCVSCHGGNLEGGGAPALSAIGATMSAEEIHDVIINGQGGMPPGIIKGEEAEAVAKWLAEKK